MRRSILLLCSLAFGLSGCKPPTRDPQLRAREERPYPNATLGTNNSESQWYRTQTIAPPSAAPIADTNAPAKLPKAQVPVRRTKAAATPAGSVPTRNPTL